MDIFPDASDTAQKWSSLFVACFIIFLVCICIFLSRVTGSWTHHAWRTWQGNMLYRPAVCRVNTDKHKHSLQRLGASNSPDLHLWTFEHTEESRVNTRKTSKHSNATHKQCHTPSMPATSNPENTKTSMRHFWKGLSKWNSILKH